MIIKETSFEKARKTIKEAEKNKVEIIFSSNDDDLNRKILEKEKIDILLINLSNRKDFQKQRNSGFNQVIAKIAKKQNTTIGINLDEIIEPSSENLEKRKSDLTQLKGEPASNIGEGSVGKINSDLENQGKILNRLMRKSEILARLKQNIKLCNKNKIKMAFIAEKKQNQRNFHDLKALASILGAPTNMIKPFEF